MTSNRVTQQNFFYGAHTDVVYGVLSISFLHTILKHQIIGFVGILWLTQICQSTSETRQSVIALHLLSHICSHCILLNHNNKQFSFSFVKWKKKCDNQMFSNSLIVSACLRSISTIGNIVSTKNNSHNCNNTNLGCFLELTISVFGRSGQSVSINSFRFYLCNMRKKKHLVAN